MDAFTQQYIETALWSSMDDDGNPLDDWAGVDDIDPATLAYMVKDCADFQESNAELLEQAGDASQNGHDFWLTRNGHGAGFWDRGYGGVGKELTAICRVWGSIDLYVGDDGRIYGM